MRITVGVEPFVADDHPPASEIDEDISLVCADQPQFRICLEIEGEDLIAPCHCKGTQKYVHRSCLDNWRSTKEGFAFVHCIECRAKFILRVNVPPDRWWLRIKFQCIVARDHAAIFDIVQLVCWCTNFTEKNYGRCSVMKNNRMGFIPRLVSGSFYQSIRRFSSTVPNDPDTHEDFRPTSKIEKSDLSLGDIVKQDVKENPVMIYMKQVPNYPRCGFSALAVRILKEYEL